MSEPSIEFIDYQTRDTLVRYLTEYREDPDIMEVDVVGNGRTLRLVRRGEESPQSDENGDEKPEEAGEVPEAPEEPEEPENGDEEPEAEEDDESSDEIPVEQYVETLNHDGIREFSREYELGLRVSDKTDIETVRARAVEAYNEKTLL